MSTEKIQNKTSNISTFQGFRGCIIQTLKTTKNHKKPKNQKKPKKPAFIFFKSWFFHPWQHV